MKRSVTIVGGVWSPLGQFPGAIDAQINLADVQNELEKHPTPAGVATYAFGAGVTVMAMASALESSALESYVAQCGNSSADDGADASRLVGDAIVQYEIMFGAYQEFVIARRNELVIDACANIDRAELTTMAGSRGGMGGGGGRRIDHTNAVLWVRGGYGVHRHFVRLGPKSHTRTSDTTDENERVAAAAYCEDVYHYMESPYISVYETREQTFIDLPLTDSDEDARAWYAATAGQALLCKELRSQLLAYKVNGKNKLKRVTIAQASWFGSLGRSVIEAAAFVSYSEALEELTEPAGVNRGVAGAILVEPRYAAGNALTVTELVDKTVANELDSEAIMAAAQTAQRQVQVDLLVTVPRGRINLNELEGFFNGFGPSYAEFKERRSCVEALLLAVVALSTVWRKRRIEATTRLAVQKRRLLLILRWSFGRGGLLARLVSAGQLLVNKKTRLRKGLEAVRSTAADVALADATTSQLAMAEQRLREESRRMDEVVARVKKCLAAFKPQRTARDASVEMQPIAVAWPTLTALKEDSYELNGKRLCSLVQFVTAHGLQQLLGASDHNVESIIAALKSAVPVKEGPHWGGETFRRYNSTVFVLPPVRESLRRGFQANRARDVEVLFADGAAAGVTIVRLRLCTPRDVAKHGLLEIFPRAIRQRFAETILPENIKDFYPNGSDAWLWLQRQLAAVLAADAETSVVKPPVEPSRTASSEVRTAANGEASSHPFPANGDS